VVLEANICTEKMGWGSNIFDGVAKIKELSERGEIFILAGG